MSDTTDHGVSELMGESDDDGVAAFLANLTGDDSAKKKSTQEESEQEPNEPDETQADEGDDQSEGSDESEGDDATAKDADPDEAEVDIKVGEEVKKAKIKDLKRLYGQEASLTQKSQKVAEEARRLEAENTRTTEAMKKMLSMAEQRAAPYKNIDWLVLAQQVDTDSLTALRNEANEALQYEQFLKNDLQGHMQKVQQDQAKAHHEQSVRCVQELQSSDTAKNIPGFNMDMWKGMMDYAKSHGAPNAERINNPAILRLLHKAMQWDTHQANLAKAKEAVKAAPNKPTQTMKPGQKKNTAPKNDAMNRLRRSGSDEDAVDAFLSGLRK